MFVMLCCLLCCRRMLLKMRGRGGAYSKVGDHSMFESPTSTIRDEEEMRMLFDMGDDGDLFDAKDLEQLEMLDVYRTQLVGDSPATPTGHQDDEVESESVGANSKYRGEGGEMGGGEVEMGAMGGTRATSEHHGEYGGGEPGAA
jgi:hypothetical protein